MMRWHRRAVPPPGRSWSADRDDGVALELVGLDEPVRLGDLGEAEDPRGPGAVEARLRLGDQLRHRDVSEREVLPPQPGFLSFGFSASVRSVEQGRAAR